MTLREYDVVLLRRGLPQFQLAAGAVGTVVLVYEDPPAYEVEFCDAEGITLALVTLREDDLERTDEQG